MTPIQLRIIMKAVEIRIANNEDIDEILNSYPKLSQEEKQFIKNKFVGQLCHGLIFVTLYIPLVQYMKV